MTGPDLTASVIVPARDSASTLPRSLACLKEQEVEFEYEVIVVDDGSRDGTPRVAEHAGPTVRLVRQDGAGPGPARNRGVAESAGAVLAFCDADCYPTPGWLAAGVGALREADLVQGCVLPDPAAEMGPFDRSLWITQPTGLWETANLFVTRRLFDQLGGFESWLEPRAGKALAEDVFFGWRAARLGARTGFCPEALVHHAVFPQRAAEYVAERRRREHFPEMLRKVPELRAEFLYARLFLDRRTAALDAALAGVAASLGLRRLAPLAAALPYLGLVASRARWDWYRAFALKVAAVHIAADLMSAWSLLRGSVRTRTAVL
jgi:glycosyltransferase involved in cell wall biosynthesis